MTDFALTGKKGTGKSKNAIRIARDDYLKNGRAVATNLDINLKPMFGVQSKKTYVRIPDKPSAFDLHAAGHGNPDSYEEDNNGALMLDELGTWLNTRSFADKGRAEVLDYLAHGRKLGWDCFYIMQSVEQVDKQLRVSFIEQTVRHTRFDKVKWPFVGGLLSALFGKKAGYMPRFHVAVARMGTNPLDLVADRAVYVGKDLEPCYDTRQVFREDYPHGTYSVLSPWHLEGRFMVDATEPWYAAWLRRIRGTTPAKPRRPALPPMTTPEPAYARFLLRVKRMPADQRLSAIRWYTEATKRRFTLEAATGPKRANSVRDSLASGVGVWGDAPCSNFRGDNGPVATPGHSLVGSFSTGGAR